MAFLELKNITKRFGTLVANDAITLQIERGEVLALLGENGAGKTTLMNILFGHYTADEGSITIDGTGLAPGSTEAAIAAGIGMVHQHFTLADNLSVLENIILGTQSLWSWRQDLSTARRKIADMAARFGLEVDPEKLVADLSVGERQRVEILKALYRDARILIMDEPTAVLTPQETLSLFETLAKLTDQGLAIIFISHKLHEILAVSNNVAVLRRGAIVATVATAGADKSSLAELMVGHKVTRPRLEQMDRGDVILQLENVHVAGGNRVPLLRDVSLALHQHEIIGIAGVAGNGQSALADLLSGLTSAASATVTLFGQSISRMGPSDIVAKGVGRIPEDRHARGMIGDMQIWENIISEDLRRPDISKWGMFIDKGAAVKRTEDLIARFDVRCEGPLAQTKLLSGGNMQKLILARGLSRDPLFILANQPVRGLDEGAIAYVHTQLLDARARGAGVLLISEDLDELFALCDTIAVMYHGTLSKPFANGSKTTAQIGLMMAGQSCDDTDTDADADADVGADAENNSRAGASATAKSSGGEAGSHAV